MIGLAGATASSAGMRKGDPFVSRISSLTGERRTETAADGATSTVGDTVLRGK